MKPYYIKPAYGFVTSFMDPGRLHPKVGVIRSHQGVDISSADDNRIFAAAAGTVAQVGYNPRNPKGYDPKGAGNFILIRHPNGHTTSYSHLSRIDVEKDDSVSKGQVIGHKGATGLATGVHLHFEIVVGSWTNNFSNKLNPLLYFVDPLTQEMQEMLSQLGYDVGAIDGKYGDKMIGAVADYQKDKGLTVDGYAGRGTYAALKADTAEQVAADVKKENEDEVDELKFVSGSLRKELEFSLSSKAHRQLLIDAAIEQGYDGVHAERLRDGTIEDGDLIALAVGTVVKQNK